MREIMLNKIISTNEQFQKSINLKFDLDDYKKINNYIPTRLSYSIFQRLINSVTNEDLPSRANIIIGPYGKGKSHLMLTFLALLKECNAEKIEIIRRRMDDFDPEFKRIFQKVKDIRLLPVIINANHDRLEKSIIVALTESIDKNKLNGFIPDTYSSVINKTVRDWESNYPEAFELFQKELEIAGMDKNMFLKSIKNQDDKVKDFFEMVYKKITFGADFNPVFQSDIIKVLEDFTETLCEKTEYNGIYLVFDEFSKFIEADVTRNIANDVKILQDLAELANRTKVKQIHLSCISHKPINEYIYKLPKERVDAWKAIEGRFTEIYFTASMNESYELINNSIIKKQGFDDYYKGYEEATMRIINLARYHGFFNGTDESVIGKGCFPLNPITTYALTRVSEKVAQNERTLFTFLSKNENYSLKQFIDNNETPFLNIDVIFDYFGILFKKEDRSQEIYKTWLKANKLICTLEDRNQIRIIKSLAVIFIVNELKSFTPTDEIIKNSLQMDDEIFDGAIKELVDQRHILKSRVNNQYKFIEQGDLNLRKMLKNEMQNYDEVKVAPLLENILEDSFVLPKRYNDDFRMIRYFKNIFIDWMDLKAIKKLDYLLEEYVADGLVINIIYQQIDNRKDISDWIKSIDINSYMKNRIVFNLPHESWYKERIDDLYLYKAIVNLEKNKVILNAGIETKHELGIYKNDVIESLKNYVAEKYFKGLNTGFYLPDHKLGEMVEVKINRASELNFFVSELCRRQYKDSPIINNEMINKNSVTKQVLNARNKIVEMIFSGLEYLKEDQICGKSPEFTILRATIINERLLDKEVLISEENSGIKVVITIIKKFVNSTDGSSRDFSELYKDLMGGTIGMRSGPIPIYLALVLKSYEDFISIYKGSQEVPLSLNTINGINNKPEDYSLYLENETNDKRYFLNELKEIFNEIGIGYEYSGKDVLSSSIFTEATCLIQKFFKSIPKCAREVECRFGNEADKLSYRALKFRKYFLKYSINSREALMEWIPKELFGEISYKKMTLQLKEIVNMYNCYYSELENHVLSKTRALFNDEYEGSFSTLLRIWVAELSPEIFEYKHERKYRELLNYLKHEMKYDDSASIQRVAQIVIGINIQDWNDNSVNEYFKEIKLFIDYVENFEAEKKEAFESKLIEKVELSQIGEIMQNELIYIFEEYADSISYKEKLSLIKGLLELVERGN